MQHDILNVVTTVYLETSIVSYLAGPIKARDMIVAANQTITREWWSFRRHAFELFASALVMVPRVYEVCRTEGYSPPFVCTPQELMGS